LGARRVDQVHRALGKALGGDKSFIGMRDDIDNRIADAHDIDRSRTHLNKAPGGSAEGGGV